MNKKNQLTIHELKLVKTVLMRRIQNFTVDYIDTHHGESYQKGSPENDFVDDLQRIICKLEGQECELFRFLNTKKFLNEDEVNKLLEEEE